MRETHRKDDLTFHYVCPFCRSVWCRTVRESGTLEELFGLGSDLVEVDGKFYVATPEGEFVEVKE